VSGLEGRSVLVTGSDGFIGSHLVQRLVREGAKVRAFCLYNSFGSAGWLDELPKEERAEIEVVLGDVRDAEFVREAVQGTEVVFHLAALIAIPYSYQAMRSYVDTNVTGTLNVLEAVRRSPTVTRMVHTSTSEVYGTPETVPITEEHALQGQSPYSASKIGADKMAESYALSFETPVVTLRPFNTYGPRQSARAVIPTLLGQLLAGVTELRLGSLDPKRDFTYATDTADGFVKAALADLEPGETVHLGTGRTVSIGELVDVCRKVTGNYAEVITEPQRVRPGRSEVMVLLSDPAKAKRVLGWEPQVSLEDGLRATAEWLAPRADKDRAVQYQR
jgi:UDP-glucose 4-epimerase